MTAKKNPTRDYYDAKAASWNAFHTDSFFSEAAFRAFEERLGKNDRVIDIGCAGGIHAPLFLGIGRKLRYRGLDISQSMIDIARSRYPQLRFSVGNLMDFSPTKKVHAVWAQAVLMHLEKKKSSKMFDHLEHITKSRGYLYFSVPSTHPSAGSSKDTRHFSLYQKKEIEAIAKKRRWEILYMDSMFGTSGKTTVWNNFLVRLPKKEKPAK